MHARKSTTSSRTACICSTPATRNASQRPRHDEPSKDAATGVSGGGSLRLNKRESLGFYTRADSFEVPRAADAAI